MAALAATLALLVLQAVAASELLVPALDADAECVAGESECALNALQHRAELGTAAGQGAAESKQLSSIRCYCHGCAAGSSCTQELASCPNTGGSVFKYTQYSWKYTSMRSKLWQTVSGKDSTYPCQMTCKDQGFEQYCDFASNKLCWTVADKHGVAVPKSISLC
mmetsp:Transcript_57656/g.115488  ORF Transcript_57656/g.115488 Transcript_57656/m.115488 type:complete len:164 (-) Transcript_57656:125-616(-)